MIMGRKKNKFEKKLNNKDTKNKLVKTHRHFYCDCILC